MDKFQCFHHDSMSFKERKMFLKKYSHKVNTNNNVLISYNVLRNSRSGKSTFKIHFNVGNIQNKFYKNYIKNTFQS